MSKEATARSAISAERAMKLALEALEYIEHNYMSLPAPAEKAITALREALASEAKEQPAPVAKPHEQEPEHIVHSNGRYSPLLTRMMNERVKSNVKQVIHLYDEPPKQPAQQEPVAWKWQPAPIRTAWGDEMVVASVAIDKDHTVCLYCEREQIAKVEVMFTSPPAQRTWVHATEWRGLTDEEVIAMSRYDLEYAALIGEVQRRLKEKNT